MNRVVHLEVHAADPERAAKFYTKVPPLPSVYFRSTPKSYAGPAGEFPMRT
jgi:predicted enzyme related to lactoylglutathione lyase